MNKFKRITALFLCICMVILICPKPAAAAAEIAWTYTQTGNSGGEISCSAAIDWAVSSDQTLCSALVSGNRVIVTGAEGAVGVADITVSSGTEQKTFQVPVGYTTFLFDGDTLTVYPGTDTNYEITGINAADEEYTSGDETYPLVTSTDAQGNTVYHNTDAYRLCVAIAKKGGSYVFAGTGSDMAIAVKKEATKPALLMLCGLILHSSFTSPITVKKDSQSTVTVTTLEGMESTLSDAPFNNADLYGDPEDGGDGTNVEYAESSVIKGKDYANVTLNGRGTLNLICTTKNAIKVNEYGALTVEEVTLNVTSAKHGLSSDNTLLIRSGNLSIESGSDGIRSDPDAVSADAGCAGCITLEGGSIRIVSGSDCIQAAQDLTVSGGTFQLIAGTGWNDASFDKDTMSCKGLKASGNLDETDTEAVATNMLTVTGGTFTINTPDDAIHSDAHITITGGVYTIDTGDDGVHADGTLILGSEGGAGCAVDIRIGHSYEGLEGAVVNIRSGNYQVTSSDDGINSAGGSDSSDDQEGFLPGGGHSSGSSDYEMNITGGNVTVYADGDGLDANGPMNLLGGTIIVWGCTGGADGALDSDGTILVSGATLFAAGGRGMAQNPGGSSQPYITSSSSISAGRLITVTNGGEPVFSVNAAKNVSYSLFSSADMTSASGWRIQTGTGTAQTENRTQHSYVSTVIQPGCCTGGYTTHTCSACGHSYVDSHTAPLGHAFGEYTSNHDASCSRDGTESACCSRCDAVTSRILEGSRTDHHYEAAVTPPDCTEEGYTVYTCSICGDSYRDDTVAALGHNWDEGTVVAPTCTEEGYTLYTCTRCGHTHTDSITAAARHSWDEGTVTREPSEGVAGVRTYTCTVCGETREEAIPPLEYTEGTLIRLYGEDRCRTALKIAAEMLTLSGRERFSTVVVASALNFPDALTGSCLAAEHQAPILLTYDAFQPELLQFLAEHLEEDGLVYILGGTGAVSQTLEDALSDQGIDSVRLAGQDRFGTNLAILDERGIESSEQILICTASGFADSLSASASGLPIVLVQGSLSDSQKAFLETTSRRFVIIGGTGAVSEALEQELKALGTVERVGGESRYDTSVLVAQRFVPDAETVIAAYARNYPDGLCAGPLAVQTGASVILTDNYDPSAADAYVAGISSGYIIGGPSLISDSAARAIFDLSADTAITVR